MISRNDDFMRQRHLHIQQGGGPNAMFALMLHGEPPKLRLVPTKDPESFVNLSYLMLALQVTPQGRPVM